MAQLVAHLVWDQRVACSSHVTPTSGGTICRGRKAEESPDRIGHPAAESADGGDFMPAVTENYRPFGAKGENARQELTTGGSDVFRVRHRDLQDQIYRQMRAARLMPGGRLRR